MKTTKNSCSETCAGVLVTFFLEVDI